jgi:hypothetical protein
MRIRQNKSHRFLILGSTESRLNRIDGAGETGAAFPHKDHDDMMPYGPGDEPKREKESLLRQIQWKNIPRALPKLVKDIPAIGRATSKTIQRSRKEHAEYAERNRKEKKNEADDTSLSGWIGICVIILIAVLCFGAYHGWDRHSYSVPVPHLSGPSDDDVIHALSSNGINVSEVVDRWDSVQSDGHDGSYGVRAGTTLYPLRVRRGGETLDLYFYYDDFGRLQFYAKQ